MSKKYFTLFLAVVMSLMLIPAGVMAEGTLAETHELTTGKPINLNGVLTKFSDIYSVIDGQLRLGFYPESAAKIATLVREREGFPEPGGAEDHIIEAIVAIDSAAHKFNVEYTDGSKDEDLMWADHFTYSMADNLQFVGEMTVLEKPLADMTEDEQAEALKRFRAELYKAECFGAPDYAEQYIDDVRLEFGTNEVYIEFIDGTTAIYKLDSVFEVKEAQKPEAEVYAWPIPNLSDEEKVAVEDGTNLTQVEINAITSKALELFKAEYSDVADKLVRIIYVYDEANPHASFGSSWLVADFSDGSSSVADDSDYWIEKPEEEEEEEEPQTLAEQYPFGENWVTEEAMMEVKDVDALDGVEVFKAKAFVKKLYQDNHGDDTLVKEIEYKSKQAAQNTDQQWAKFVITLRDDSQIVIPAALVLRATAEQPEDEDKDPEETDPNDDEDPDPAEKPLAESIKVEAPSRKLIVKDMNDISASELENLKKYVKQIYGDKASNIEKIDYLLGNPATVKVVFTDKSFHSWTADKWMANKDEQPGPTTVDKGALKDVLEAVYERLNDKVNPPSNIEFFNLKIGYDRAIEVYKNDHATQAEVDAEVKALQKLMGLDIVAPINRAELEALIRKAYDVLNGREELPYGFSMDALRKAYDEAYDVFRDNAASQNAIDEQCTKLRKAMGLPEPVKKPLDRSKLDELIKLAYGKLIEGTKEMTIDQYNRLKAVYDQAYAVYQDNSAKQSDIDKQVQALAKAMGLEDYYNGELGPVDRKALAELINKAYEELNSGKLSTADYANLKLAYDNAYNAYQNSASTQKDINEHVQKLRQLLGIVQPVPNAPSGGTTAIGVNKNYLKEALDLAYAKLTSTSAPLAKAEYDKLHPAYEKALGVYQNAAATQAQVDAEVTALKLAMGIVDVPRTADIAPVLYAIMALSIMAAGTVMFAKKKRQTANH